MKIGRPFLLRGRTELRTHGPNELKEGSAGKISNGLHIFDKARCRLAFNSFTAAKISVKKTKILVYLDLNRKFYFPFRYFSTLFKLFVFASGRERASSLATNRALFDGDDHRRLAGLAFMFSASILLQVLACALYNNWWPMLSALMYVLVPMPCLFFGGGSTQILFTRESDGWINAAKFLTGASTVGSLAIPIILRHAHMIETSAMWIEFVSFFIFVCTVMCFHRASLEDEW